MKSLLVAAAVLGIQTGSSSIELNPAQTKAMLAAMSHDGLSGLKSVSISVIPPHKDDDLKFDPSPLKDIVELELRRSGVPISEIGGDAIVFVSVSLLPTSAGGRPNGCCGNIDLTVEATGFMDHWQSSGLVHLFDNSDLFTTPDLNPQHRLEEVLEGQARKLSLDWLRQHSKSVPSAARI